MYLRTEKKVWTYDECEKLSALLKEYRYTTYELCKIFKCTETSLKHRIKRLNLPYRPIKPELRLWGADEVEQLLQMQRDGKNWFEIGQALGRSETAVHCKWLKIERGGGAL